MASPGQRRHDRDILDALEALTPEAFQGDVWRVTAKGRDPLRGSSSPGRWSPAQAFEVLYTSLEPDGALAEIGYRMSLEPVWPSRLQHELHCLSATMRRALRFPDLAALAPFGVDAARYGSFDYAATQALAAAAQFLEFDALIVQSARSPALQMVVLLENTANGGALDVRSSAPVDWEAWRRQERDRGPADGRRQADFAMISSAMLRGTGS